jgi:hypothetical protein
MRTLLLLATLTGLPLWAQAPNRTADSLAVLALADSALAAINRGDMLAFTDLMVDEATITTINGQSATAKHRVRTRAAERAVTMNAAIVERGFNATALVSAAMATVWLPYDLYVNGAWSHCGVDVFTMVRTAGAWKIATLAYTIEQPPACAKHPAGPPRTAR